MKSQALVRLRQLLFLVRRMSGLLPRMSIKLRERNPPIKADDDPADSGAAAAWALKSVPTASGAMVGGDTEETGRE